jgi:anaerobic ribonucleoside-triphosphate reductase activating protein
MTVASLLLELMAADPVSEGLTVSGGEPLEQPDAIAELAAGWRAATGSGVIILTGLSWEEIGQDSATREAARRADLVIAGRYNERLRIGEGLRGSSNKTYHFLTDEYCIDQFTNLPEFEAVIGKDGTVHVTGVAGSHSLAKALRPQPPR